MKGKKGKAKTEKKEEPAQEIIKPDFNAANIGKDCPLYVKVKNKKDVFIIFTQEFKNALSIKEEISKLKEIPVDCIRLYMTSKRLIEDNSTNHDQQIKHNTLLYATFKNSTTNEWENMNDILNYKSD